MNKLLLLTLFFSLLMGCDKSSSQKQNSLSNINAKKIVGDRQIDANRVCMYYDIELSKISLFPVNINGKTYYGCCNQSQANLYSDSTKRVAIEPITKKPIDKSDALIFIDLDNIKDNKVLYFESKENHSKYLLAKADTK